ncbi:hypothetical protein [Cytobacillus purgationiresistens]|uniref:Uncharacterized protein n=1 Tax=Cytobacillus purgationiresistens TaxID=863449 RepID=A0ABU0AK03_9BACI|nr:hypothetical protein [Cytobacillus purgationiresistens]MDQ0270380.1 hypothetical protein [Cytobacillus purgationiresistens]
MEETALEKVPAEDYNAIHSTYDGSVTDNHQVGYLIEEPKLFNNKTGLFHLTYFREFTETPSNSMNTRGSYGTCNYSMC